MCMVHAKNAPHPPLGSFWNSFPGGAARPGICIDMDLKTDFRHYRTTFIKVEYI